MSEGDLASTSGVICGKPLSSQKPRVHSASADSLAPVSMSSPPAAPLTNPRADVALALLLERGAEVMEEMERGLAGGAAGVDGRTIW